MHTHTDVKLIMLIFGALIAVKYLCIIIDFSEGGKEGRNFLCFSLIYILSRRGELNCRGKSLEKKCLGPSPDKICGVLRPGVGINRALASPRSPTDAMHEP